MEINTAIFSAEVKNLNRAVRIIQEVIEEPDAWSFRATSLSLPCGREKYACFRVGGYRRKTILGGQ